MRASFSAPFRRTDLQLVSLSRPPSSLPSSLTQVPVVAPVRLWDVLLVPTLPVALLIASDEQDRGAIGVKGEQHPQVPADRSQLLHVVMPRAVDRVRPRPCERRPALLQQFDRGTDALGIRSREPLHPSLRFGGEHDLPGHPRTVAPDPATNPDTNVATLPQKSCKTDVGEIATPWTRFLIHPPGNGRGPPPRPCSRRLGGSPHRRGGAAWRAPLRPGAPRLA